MKRKLFYTTAHKCPWDVQRAVNTNA